MLNAIRPLTDAEADLVLQLRESPQVTTILAEGSENAISGPVQQAAAIASAFEQPPIQPVAAPVQIVQPAPQPQPQVVHAPPVQIAQAAVGAKPINVPSFGGAEPKVAAGAAPLQHPVQQVVHPAPQPARQPHVMATPTAAPASNFEAELDAKLDQLLVS